MRCRAWQTGSRDGLGRALPTISRPWWTAWLERATGCNLIYVRRIHGSCLACGGVPCRVRACAPVRLVARPSSSADRSGRTRAHCRGPRGVRFREGRQRGQGTGDHAARRQSDSALAELLAVDVRRRVLWLDWSSLAARHRRDTPSLSGTRGVLSRAVEASSRLRNARPWAAASSRTSRRAFVRRADVGCRQRTVSARYRGQWRHPG